MKKIKETTYKAGGKKNLKDTQFSSKKPRVPQNYTFNNTGVRGK